MLLMRWISLVNSCWWIVLLVERVVVVWCWFVMGSVWFSCMICWCRFSRKCLMYLVMMMFCCWIVCWWLFCVFFCRLVFVISGLVLLLVVIVSRCSSMWKYCWLMEKFVWMLLLLCKVLRSWDLMRVRRCWFCLKCYGLVLFLIL